MKRFMKILTMGMLSVSLVFGSTSVFALEPANQVEADQKAKYVFLFVGDGFGPAQKQVAELYLQYKSGDKTQKLEFSKFPEVGLTTTQSADYSITDSAAAATALATGYKTNNGMIGVTPDGKSVETLIEKAEKLGMATGLISTARITHATPASFAAHDDSRGNENDIADDYLVSGVDYFAGGGARHLVGKDYKGKDVIGKDIKTKRTDDKDLIKAFEAKGYKTFVGETGYEVFKTYKPAGEQKVVATFASSHMPYVTEEEGLYSERAIPSLAEMVEKGIDVLDNYKNGFVMMVEAGRIDQAAHAHDAASTIKDTLALNDAVKEAYEFYMEHPEETLIVVLGDHETGGMSIAANTSYDLNFEPVEQVKVSVEDTLQGVYNGDRVAYFKYIEENLGLKNFTEQEKARIERGMDIQDAKGSYASYGEYFPVAIETIHVLNDRMSLGFTTYTHSGVVIPVYSVGIGAGYFGGNLDNTDIPKIITALID